MMISTNNLDAESNIKVDIVGAIMQAGFIIVGIGIGSWAFPVDQIDILGVDNNVPTTLFWSGWWSGAAQPQAGFNKFFAPVSEGWWVIPLLAWGQALDNAVILHNTKVSNVVLISGATVQGDGASGPGARASGAAGNDFGR